MKVTVKREPNPYDGTDTHDVTISFLFGLVKYSVYSEFRCMDDDGERKEYKVFSHLRILGKQVLSSSHRENYPTLYVGNDVSINLYQY